MIKFYIQNSYTKFETGDNGTLKILHDLLSYEPKNAAFLARKLRLKFKNTQSFLDIRNSRFLTGFLSLIIKTLKANNKEYEVFDLRKNPITSVTNHTLDGITLYDYQERTVNDFFKATRGIAKIATGGGKCLGKDTEILMYDGSIKLVQDVVVGDVLMGDDSTPRNVLSTCTGREELFLVDVSEGKPYIVNKSHILSIKTKCGQSKLDLPVTEILEFFKSEKLRKIIVGYRINPKTKQLTEYNFTLKSLGEGDYYGFEIDGNKRFLLGDCTVTHNTESAISITKGLNVPTIFLTHRVNLLHQTKRRFEQRLPEFKGKIGIIGDSIFEPGFITIGTVQTIHSMIKSNPDKIIPILKQYQLLIIDEAHRSGAKQFWETASYCENAYYRLALTATPFMKENLEEDLFLLGTTGEIFTEVTNEELIDRGIIAKPFFKFFTIDQPKKIKSLKDWHQIYDAGITNNEFRNKIIANQALQLYNMQKRIMIITTQVKHGKILEKMIKEVGVDCVFLSGSTDTSTRERLLKQLDSGELSCLIATNIFDEGISINGINAIILAAGTKSAPALFQRTGRGLRTKEDGNYCIIIDFIDTQHSKLMSHSMKRYNLIKNEKGFHIL